MGIQFEREAFFPKTIEVLTKLVHYRRKNLVVPNAEDFWRHEVLHSYCGTGDIHQAMVKGNVLFGIDAADCRFHPPLFQGYWQHLLEHDQTHDPARLPLHREMMQHIAAHPELPDLVEQELANAPGPVWKHLGLSHYGENIRKMHANLIQALT